MLSTSGTITSANGAVTWDNPRGDLWGFVVVSGTDGAVLAFEASADGGSTWSAEAVERFDATPTVETGYTLADGTTPPLWWWKRGAGKKLRVRATSLASGSVVVKLYGPGMTWYKLARMYYGVNTPPYLPLSQLQPPTPGIPVAAVH